MVRDNNVNVQVYSSCNCNCEFCNFTDRKSHKIDPQYVLKYLRENPSVNYVLLTGGEPTFAIEECCEIIKGINLEDKRVILQTNGWWGDNQKVKEFIKTNPPSCVHLSVDQEKQKKISLEVVKKAYNFLLENNIQVFVVNHHYEDKEDEFEYYKTHFPNLKYGRIISDEETDTDCGVALLATNQIGTLDIKGWR